MRGGALGKKMKCMHFRQSQRLTTTNKTFFVGISMFDILVLLVDANMVETV